MEILAGIIFEVLSQAINDLLHVKQMENNFW